MSFTGFRNSDFDLFAVPEFAARMAAIRSELRPKLVVLAGELAPSLSEILGGPIFPHAADHMRRRDRVAVSLARRAPRTMRFGARIATRST